MHLCPLTAYKLRMQILVTSEERFSKTADGKIWSSGAGTYLFWTRYLDVFDQVRVFARVKPVVDVSTSAQRADGEGVTFQEIPYYLGPVECALKHFKIRAAIRKALVQTDAVVLRAASPIANSTKRELADEQPFGIEVIGDPYEVFAPGSVKHPLRPILRWVMTDQLKRQCGRACAVAYVEGNVLPHRYPARSSAFTTTYSSIELQDDAYIGQPRGVEPRSGPLRIVSLGTLEVPYKGFDVLIDAVSACVKNGMEIQLSIVGNGRCRSSLEAHAQRLGIQRAVRFVGRVPAGRAVRQILDGADLFVLASKTEGLPRAMIEAMARGLPCIGSAVGGIPELLSPEELVSRGDAVALACKIGEISADPGRMSRLSTENLARARNYHDSILRKRRRAFLTHVQEETREWDRRPVEASADRNLGRDRNSVQAEGLR
jgi:glycosyltransferase involved in cell wall biosynthesis